MQSDVTTPTFFSFIRAAADHWVTLMSGCGLIVAVGLFERFFGWNIPRPVYAYLTIALLFLACYLAWRDAVLKAADKDLRKREYRIGRLQDFIKEGVENQSWGGLRLSVMENWGRIDRRRGYRPRVERFLTENYDQPYVQRFRDKGYPALEEILDEEFKENGTGNKGEAG